MGFFSRSKPNAETLTRLQDYNECYGNLLEQNVFIAEQIGNATLAKEGRKHANVIARFIRIARSSNDRKAREILATFETDFKVHLDGTDTLKGIYKSRLGKDFDPTELLAAKESGWKLI
jgi:hypothetical protein